MSKIQHFVTYVSSRTPDLNPLNWNERQVAARLLKFVNPEIAKITDPLIRPPLVRLKILAMTYLIAHLHGPPKPLLFDIIDEGFLRYRIPSLVRTAFHLLWGKEGFVQEGSCEYKLRVLTLCAFKLI